MRDLAEVQAEEANARKASSAYAEWMCKQDMSSVRHTESVLAVSFSIFKAGFLASLGAKQPAIGAS